MTQDRMTAPEYSTLGRRQSPLTSGGKSDSANLYARLVESARDITFLLTPDGLIAYVSAGIQAYGFRVSELEGQPVSAVVHPEDVALVLSECGTVLADGGEFTHLHARLLLPDGSLRYLVANGGAVTASGLPYVYGIARDITDSVELNTLLASRTAALSAVNSMALDLTGAQPVGDTLRQTLQKLCATIGLPSAAVFLLDEDGSLRLEERHNLGPMPEDVSVGLRNGAVAHCAKSGSWLTVNDVAEDPRYTPQERQLLLDAGARSGVAVPLKCGDGISAVLVVASPEPVTLSVEQMEFLSIAAGILGPAIANARLHSDQADRASVLSMLERLAKSINSGRDIPSIIEACMREIRALVECEVAAVVLFAGDTLVRVFRSERSKDTVAEERMHVPPERLAAMMRLAEPVVLKSGEFDLAGYAADRLSGTAGTGIATPLICKGSSSGLLEVWTSRGDGFGAREVDILGAAAEHLAIAVNNARLYEAEHVRSLQLATLAKEAQHRIKNNLQMITGLLALSETQDCAGQAISRCLRQVNAIATVHELLQPAESTAVDMKTCLERIARSAVLACGRGEEIELKVSGDSKELSADQATALGIVVNELVTNSVTHGFSARSFGGIEIEVKCDEHSTVVTVRDDGCGMPQDFCMDAAEESSSGLGLVHSLMTHGLGGAMDVRSPDEGVEVRIAF